MLAKIPVDCKITVPRNKRGTRVRPGHLEACSRRQHGIPFAWVCAGPLATANRELRQARKGAAVAGVPGAGVWLARAFLILHQIRAIQSSRFPETLIE